MGKLHIFNPENDLALAYGGDIYTAPTMARRLHRDLEMLPIWIANDGDYLCVENPAQNQEWLETHPALPKCRLLPCSNLQNTDAIPTPWGWSRAIRHYLKNCGLRESLMPAIEDLDIIRNLSHRRTSIALHHALSDMTQENLIPTECTDYDQILTFAKLNPGCFAKAPWSSSGKGIFKVDDAEALAFKLWCQGVLRTQGSVICERGLKKILDFAIEFYASDNGEIEFKGYSVFGNDNRNSYDFGYVASPEILRSMITSKINSALFDGTIEETQKALSKTINGKYRGWLGVDMMLYERNGKTLINPCVELNLRTTMGAVASVIGHRHIKPGETGKMYVRFFKTHEALVAEASHLSKENALILTPIHPNSQYLAYLRYL